MSSTNEIQTEAVNALDEYTYSCTVAIASTNPEVQHGSGVAVKFEGQCYILTAAHVLDGEPDNEKIRILGRPDGPLQLLRGKQELADAAKRGTHRAAFSSAVRISITDRRSHATDDIAALKVQNPEATLPRTVFHELSAQGEANVAVGMGVTILGFPGELAHHYEQKSTGHRGWTVFPHITTEVVTDTSAAPGTLDPIRVLTTSFDYPEETCNPLGMSGCGVWSFPEAKAREVWSPSKSRVLGILIGHYREAKMLRFTRIEWVKEAVLSQF